MSLIIESEHTAHVRYRVVTIFKQKDGTNSITTCNLKDKNQADKIASYRRQMIHRDIISSDVCSLITTHDKYGYLIIYRGFCIRTIGNNIFIVDTRHIPAYHYYDFNEITEAIDFIDKMLLNEKFEVNNNA